MLFRWESLLPWIGYIGVTVDFTFVLRFPFRNSFGLTSGITTWLLLHRQRPLAMCPQCHVCWVQTAVGCNVIKKDLWTEGKRGGRLWSELVWGGDVTLPWHKLVIGYETRGYHSKSSRFIWIEILGNVFRECDSKDLSKKGTYGYLRKGQSRWRKPLVITPVESKHRFDNFNLAYIKKAVLMKYHRCKKLWSQK